MYLITCLKLLVVAIYKCSGIIICQNSSGTGEHILTMCHRNTDVKESLQGGLDSAVVRDLLSEQLSNMDLFSHIAFSLINSGEEEKVKKLVDKDIQEHGRSTILTLKHQNRTPLLWAAHLGQTTLVEFLLSRGADSNAREKHNRTALICAADRGDLETALCLIKHGADLKG